MRARTVAMALALAALSIAKPAAAAPQPLLSATVNPYAEYVTQAAQRFGIPENWIWAVMRVESRGNPRAVSPAGAMGLMQIMPVTWAMLTARFSLGADPYEPRANVHAGAAYLRLMWDRYGNVSAMLAAYNAGPGRADAWLARQRGLPAETIAYVTRIAPTIDQGGSTPTALIVADDPFAWRRAVLFVGRGDHADAVAETATGTAVDEPFTRSPDTSDKIRRAPDRAPISGLFAPLSSRGKP